MDRYTRILLAVIAVLMAVIVLRPILQPATVAAQSERVDLRSVAFMGDASHNGFWAVDTKSGEIYRYSGNNVTERWKIVRLGDPLQNQ